jgi:hypothetical protein
MRVRCHNVVNGFGATNSVFRRYPANPPGAVRHNRLDERRSGGISLRRVAGE